MNTENNNHNIAKILLAASAYRWRHRTYEVNFSAEDFAMANKQIKDQDEQIDDIILLKVDYNIITGKAIITDKVRMCH